VTTLLATCPCNSPIQWSSEMSVSTYRTTWCHNTVDHNFENCTWNLKMFTFRN
jgi:hypothetical protein